MSESEINPERALREAARRMRELAAIRETQAREYKADGNLLRALDCQTMADDLVWVAADNERAAALWPPTKPAEKIEVTA